jgi:uncharacterized protein
MLHRFTICFILVAIISCNTPHHIITDKTETHIFRLKPGQDLRFELEQYVKNNNINAAWVATCVGSLTTYNIRFANQQNGSTANGHYEIMSLVGTLSKNGSHIHMSISDSTGHTIGGHLLLGNIVYTTAEIVLKSSNTHVLKREKDGTTPWEELQVEKK